MTNKELAVQLYSSILQASATVISNPNYAGKTVKVPTAEEAVQAVQEIALLLSQIENY